MRFSLAPKLLKCLSLATLALLPVLAGLAGCSKPQTAQEMLRIDGSSTVYPITEAVSEEFQASNKNVKVTVGISGTGGGFKKFCRGEVDITEASRPILKKEMDACKKMGIEYIELPIAYDALTVVINPQNEFIKSLTVAELKTIWEPAAQAKIKTWKQVNPDWPDLELKLFGAGTDSGTFDYFTEAIIGKAKSSRGDFTASEDDNVLVNGVAGAKGSLGYFGYAYYVENKDKVKAVPIVAKPGAPAVLPSEQSVRDGSYQPLSRPLFIYVNAASASKSPVQGFVDYYLTHAAPMIEEVKFIPLPKNEQQAVLAHWQSRKTGSGFGGVPEVGVKIEELLKRIR
ncbi:MAG TPA: PstS family phosphate ABC transporter substrate-binding protein [Methylophilaceae bacterium]|nr:PstS family phosphate ABC transporter substrate-binding protein [Methylophilaceae bacterium]